MMLDAPLMFAVAAGVWCATIAAALVRRVRVGTASGVLLAAGLAMLALAAGRPQARLGSGGDVVVLVDLSASTRSAEYRDRATLERRIDALLGDHPHRVVYFADGERTHVAGTILPDLPSQRTVFPSITADAIVLFSDGRFDPPDVTPPVFAIIDPGLTDPGDSAVRWLKWQDQPMAEVMITGQARRLVVNDAEAIDVQPGAHLIPLNLLRGSQRLTVRLEPPDAWPQNDALSIDAPPPAEWQRWWVSDRSPPSSQWVAISAGDLPTAPQAWLAAGVVVLDNIPADALSLPQQQRLTQYVRDLGGGLVVIGGDRAFAAGAYSGSQVDALLPLSATPPQPTRHWLILTDASGSMAQPTGDRTRMQIATDAVLAAMNALPRQDIVTLGSFAESVRWWIDPTPVAEVLHQSLPPRDLHPHGPTNLQAALQHVVASVDTSMPTELLLLTDGQASLDDADAWSNAFTERRIRLHLLALGEGEATDALRQIAHATAGDVLSADAPGRWVELAVALAQQAMADHLMRDPIDVRVRADLPFAADRAAIWNRTWLRQPAELLAEATHGDGQVPMIARWQFGAGRVMAAAYPMQANRAAALAELIEAQPADPRFTVSWDTADRLRVEVDAVDAQGYLNDLQLNLKLADADAPANVRIIPLQQIAPGRYAADQPSPRQPAIASVRLGSQILSRRALAGRYAPEFERIGIDRTPLADLAGRTGGRLIEPEDQRPINLPQVDRWRDLTTACALAGAGLLAAGLIIWRRRG